MVSPLATWSEIVWMLRVMWACRVSVLSAVAGLLLFGQVDQAQNLLEDTSFGPALGGLYWAGFFIAVFFLWAFSIAHGARQTLHEPYWIFSARTRAVLSEHDSRTLAARAMKEHRALITWVPRFLGLVPFIAIGLGLHGARVSVQNAANIAEGAQALRLIRTLVVANLVTAGFFIAFIVVRSRLVAHVMGRIDRHPRIGGFKRGERMLTRLAEICTLITFGMFLLAYAAPLWLFSYVSRAALAPFLLGCLVLPLSWLARKSHAHGVPYLALILCFCAFVAGLNRPGHDLRLLARNPEIRAPRQIDVATAARMWKAANGCAGAGQPCPPALIIAAEGGASRAAFMAASTIGEILDRDRDLHDPEGLNSPGRRIFAISGVSGGALAAVVIRAALDAAAAGPDPTRPPCRRAPESWFRAEAAKAVPALIAANWRYCLQELTSGDYLSPTVIGLAFRDVLAPPLYGLPDDWRLEDRAALMEQSWERHYAGVLDDIGASSCGANDRSGLCQRFGYPGRVERNGAWLPLLLLNGTSVETGRRIMISEIASSIKVGDKCFRLYPEAYDIFEMMGDVTRPRDSDEIEERKPVCGPPSDFGAPDLRLSTAALASARFPIISPAGHIQPANAGQYGDRVIDGSFFENAGLTTAHDLASALARENVRPIILWAANEPVVDTALAVAGDPPAQTPPIGLSDDNHFLIRAFGLLGRRSGPSSTPATATAGRPPPMPACSTRISSMSGSTARRA